MLTTCGNAFFAGERLSGLFPRVVGRWKYTADEIAHATTHTNAITPAGNHTINELFAPKS